MTLHLLSLDFRHTPIVLREKVAFGVETVPAALRELLDRGAQEAAILSTCNRVELLAETGSNQGGKELLLTFLSDWHGISPATLDSHAVHLAEIDAARHLFQVACGLESLVPGEMQILGQVREAARVASESGTIGDRLNQLFTRVKCAGRRARHETSIARRPVSLSHAAVALIQEHFGDDLSGRQVLLVGSGKMGETAARQLHQAGAAHVIVANRTLERACHLARRWNGTPIPLDDMPSALNEADAVISATGAPHLVLHAEQVRQALAHRSNRALLLVDLAVPRDVDPAAGSLPGVTLVDVDGLAAVVSRNIELRNDDREQVEQIIEDELQKLIRERAARAVASTITDLRRSAESIRQAELDKAMSRLAHLSEREWAIIEAMSHGLVNKLLHTPTARLREHAAYDEGEQFKQTVETLFALGEKAS